MHQSSNKDLFSCYIKWYGGISVYTWICFIVDLLEQVTCADQIQVIEESDFCDGTVQCIDGSDEIPECCK